MTWRVLVVDDEPPARMLLESRLAEDASMEVVGACGTVAEAVALIASARPDLVFLDIQLSDGTGFDVVERVGAAEMPAVVFVTAYDEHAVRAFEVNAADYLLKPVDAERFAQALERAKARLGQGEGAAERTARMLELIRAGQERLAAGMERGARPPAGYLPVRTRAGVRIVRVETVRYLAAEGHFVRVHAGTETLEVRATLQEYEDQLDPARFVRIHRATIVNLDFVRELRPWFRGDYLVQLTDGTELKLSRHYRPALEARLATRW
jgi:two-component system LytT family response regulator